MTPRAVSTPTEHGKEPRSRVMRQLGQVQATKQGQTLHLARDPQPCSLLPLSAAFWGPASPHTDGFPHGCPDPGPTSEQLTEVLIPKARAVNSAFPIDGAPYQV